MGDQLSLKLEHPERFDRAFFIRSASNEEAARRLDGWPTAAGGVLALIGPAGAGKSHLAAMWRARVGATAVTAERLSAEGAQGLYGPLLFEDADRAAHGEALFHLLNRAERGAASLLMTGRTPPAAWRAEVADLRSRLNAVPVIEAHEPDDAVLRGVLVKLFRERNIRPSPELLTYLLTRIDRSAPAAEAVVAALDEAAAAEQRPVSRALARLVLKDEAEAADEA